MGNCKDCRYFQRGYSIGGGISGECRRNPPVRAPGLSSAWPPVGGLGWCGEFYAVPADARSRGA